MFLSSVSNKIIKSIAQELEDAGLGLGRIPVNNIPPVGTRMHMSQYLLQLCRVYNFNTPPNNNATTTATLNEATTATTNNKATTATNNNKATTATNNKEEMNKSVGMDTDDLDDGDEKMGAIDDKEKRKKNSNERLFS